jgi:crotonobetainyl-CoA:carnitine CoA-transferase CaiB-like acyl-CoA transferase
MLRSPPQGAPATLAQFRAWREPAVGIQLYRAPPLLGANTNEVLMSIGYDEAKVAGLKERKVI